jgi:Rrf2 family transcriptional regulator, nitric oxide-sensitive transcriptional repressor
MQLTRHTDYALRTLLFLAASEHRVVTIEEISDRFNMNRNHLKKVVNHLSRSGFVESRRGVGGGLVLSRPAEQINLAKVVDEFEPSSGLLECFDAERNTCPAVHGCRLKGVLAKARGAFMSELFDYSIADLLGSRPADLLHQLSTK